MKKSLLFKAMLWVSVLSVGSLLPAFGASAGTSLPAESQRPELDGKAQTLQSVLRDLQKKYKVYLNYEVEVVKGKMVSAAAFEGAAGIDESLQRILNPLGLKYEKLREKYYVIYPKERESRTVPSQRETSDSSSRLENIVRTTGQSKHYDKIIRAEVARTVSGKVTDQENGQALPGVSIVVRGTTQGTVTDVEGNYKISIGDDVQTLVFSYIGYVTKIVELNGRQLLDVAMTADIQALQEVVVVGYGTQKKSVVTGAISSVKSTDLENQQIGRLEQALQGRASGLTIASSSGAPGSTATVRIRGTTSLNEGASNPLYVVDGVVVGTGGIDYLNPSDIESIEVLKDAASAAIYGARSSAGVILVTTKKGTSGGIRVNYSGYYGGQAPAKKLDLLDASQYATLMNEQAVNDGKKAPFADPASYGKGTDWQKLIFNNNARIQNHELSISGGTDRSTFYTSFGYYDQQGIVASEVSGFQRYNIRLNSSHKIKDWLVFGQTLGYSHIRNKSGVNANSNFGGPLSSALMLDPITPTVITDPTVAGQVPYSTQPVVRDAQGNPYGISDYIAQQVTNPLAFVQTVRGNYNWSDDIVGNVFVEAEPLKGLKLRSTVGTTLSYNGNENFTPLSYLNSNQLTTQTSFSRFNGKTVNWNLENTASYRRTAGKHDFTILVGQGAYLDNNSTGLTVTYFNLPVNTFKEASMNYSTSANDINATGYEGINHKVSSLFSRVTYSYNEKYLFTGVLRRDGSSRFGFNNRFGYFPSASVGWVASQEDFWTIKNTINFLKFRASYGVTGNDVLGNFRYLSTVGGGRNFTFGNDNYLIGYSPDAPANPDLRWEQTSQLNFGVDMVLFQDWNLTFDWYNKLTTGILQTVTFPAYVGATGSSYGNVADMSNRGVELELGYRKQVGGVKLNLRGNISYLKNEVKYLGEGKDFLQGGATLQNSTYELTRTAVGHAIGSFYGFQTQGIFQNQQEIEAYTGPDGKPIQPAAQPGDFRWADINNDGQITSDDRTFIGDPIPNWSFGFTANASWKNFDLLVFGQGVAGNDIFQGLRRLDIPTANWQTSVLDRWTEPGTSDTYPRLTTKDANKNFANPSDFHLERGDYFRIKSLQVGYTLPKAIAGKVGLQKARIYVSSNNLITFTKYTGYDPEIGGSSYGIDRAIYPQSRSFLLGLNLGF
ncbi:SusC/RagA family TonB-linked outer membrane protein [Salmonirosea aquatica]